VCAAVEPAWAQIYAWRDAKGNMVFSDKKRPDGGEVITYEVQGAPEIRTTRPAEPADESLKPMRRHIDELIQYHAKAQGLSPTLVRAVVQAESGFNPSAISPKGALGLMQLMPATARELGVDNPFHPEQNIRGGVTYLKRLLDMYNQDLTLALAAYNAGPASVERYGDVPPYQETQDYVSKITTVTTRKTPPPTLIYKWLDIVGGRPVYRYTNKPPDDRPYEVIGRQ
jgi:soluble lytic murein transglycosylase-like protein